MKAKLMAQVNLRLTEPENSLMISLGGYSPSMGHSSTLAYASVGMEDNRDGNLFLTVGGQREFSSAAEAAEAIRKALGNSPAFGWGTRGSRFTGRVFGPVVVELRPADEHGSAEATVSFGWVGTADGSAGSIVTGIACHLGWAITGWESVSGRFGTFIGPDSFEAYEAAKAAHRARYFSPMGEPTALALETAKVLGHRIDGCRVYGVVDPDMPWTQWTQIPNWSTDQWADLVPSMLADKARRDRLARLVRLTGREVPAGVRDVRFTEKPRTRVRWELVKG